MPTIYFVVKSALVSLVDVAMDMVIQKPIVLVKVWGQVQVNLSLGFRLFCFSNEWIMHDNKNQPDIKFRVVYVHFDMKLLLSIMRNNLFYVQIICHFNYRDITIYTLKRNPRISVRFYRFYSVKKYVIHSVIKGVHKSPRIAYNLFCYMYANWKSL